MTDREKLIELIEYAEGMVNNDIPTLEQIADHLIANGVTFAKDINVPSWIPVTERLPNEEDADEVGCVLAIERMDGFARRWEIGGIWTYPDLYTHWMPLPKPPKEVDHDS